jgi:hypothetical protein
MCELRRLSRVRSILGGTTGIQKGASPMAFPRPRRNGHMFLIATYRRRSGTDLTASNPSAAPAAAMAMAATYPSVRMMSLLLVSGSMTAARHMDVHLSRCGQHPACAGSLPVWPGPSHLIAVPGQGGR